ncbi:MAG: hypothetical protein R6X32_10735 [Chloroflexota bacterium]|jgi:hypothetical protein
MILEPRPLNELTQEGLHLLYRELGLVNTVRFLNQFTAGYGNYTEERRELTEHQSLAEALAELHAYQVNRPPRPQDLLQ